MGTNWGSDYTTGIESSTFGDFLIFGILGIIGIITIVTVLSGIGIAISNSESAKKHPEYANKNKHGFLKGLLIYLAVIIAVLYIGQIVDCVANSSNKDGWINPFSRTAKTDDIQVSQSLEFNLNDNYTVRACTYNIKNLEITVHFFDSSNREVTSKTSIIGNIEAFSEKKFSFSLSEFSASEIFTIRKWNATVTGGTISWFSIIPTFFD